MEYLSIVFAGALIWLSALVQHINTGRTKGPAFALSDRSEALPDSGFTGRSARTLRNNIESALMYLPPMLIIILLGQQSALTSYLATAYIALRTAFTLAYWFRINLLRTAAWLGGMIVIAITIGVAATTALSL